MLVVIHNEFGHISAGAPPVDQLSEIFAVVPVIDPASVFGTSREQRPLPFFPSALCRLRGEGDWLSSFFYSFPYALSRHGFV
jgi:hypothetical protein